MFRFESPTYLLLLLLIPLLAIAYFMSVRRRVKRLRKFGDVQLLKTLMPDYSAFRNRLKFLLLISSFALLVFGVAVFYKKQDKFILHI